MAEPDPQPPAHWSGSEPRQVLAPDGSVVGPIPEDLDASALERMSRVIGLADTLAAAQEILNGTIRGRVVVDVHR